MEQVPMLKLSLLHPTEPGKIESVFTLQATALPDVLFANGRFYGRLDNGFYKPLLVAMQDRDYFTLPTGDKVGLAFYKPPQEPDINYCWQDVWDKQGNKRDGLSHAYEAERAANPNIIKEETERGVRHDGHLDGVAMTGVIAKEEEGAKLFIEQDVTGMNQDLLQENAQDNGQTLHTVMTLPDDAQNEYFTNSEGVIDRDNREAYLQSLHNKPQTTNEQAPVVTGGRKQKRGGTTESPETSPTAAQTPVADTIPASQPETPVKKAKRGGK